MIGIRYEITGEYHSIMTARRHPNFDIAMEMEKPIAVSAGELEFRRCNGAEGGSLTNKSSLKISGKSWEKTSNFPGSFRFFRTRANR
jgi:hypothetical protein